MWGCCAIGSRYLKQALATARLKFQGSAMAEQRTDRPNRKPGRPVPNGGMRFGRGLFGWVLFVGLAIMLFLLISQQGHTQTEIKYNEFQAKLEAGEVATVIIEGNMAHGELRPTAE